MTKKNKKIHFRSLSVSRTEQAPAISQPGHPTLRCDGIPAHRLAAASQCHVMARTPNQPL